MNKLKKISIITGIVLAVVVIFTFAYNLMNNNNYLLIGFSRPITNTIIKDNKNNKVIKLNDEKEIDEVIDELRISKWKPYFIFVKEQVKQSPNYIMYIDKNRSVNFIYKDKKTSYCSITINGHTKYFKVPLDSYRIIERLITNTNE